MTETLGKYMISCREKKGLAVDEVAQITRINPRLINAAEMDRFDELPGKVFIRGFLRSYAQVVGVDSSEFITRFESLGLVEVDKSPKLISMPLHDDSTGTSVVMLYAAIITSLVIVGFYYFGPRIDTDPLLSAHKEPAAPAVTEKISTAAIKPEPASTPRDNMGAVEQSDGAPANAVEEATRNKEIGAAQAEIPETKIGVEPDATVSDDLPYSLKFMAESDSWIKVVIDDESEREIILRGGNSVTWMAKKGYLISIGNVAGTRMFLNEEEIILKQPSSNVLINIQLPGADSDEMEKIQ